MLLMTSVAFVPGIVVLFNCQEYARVGAPPAITERVTVAPASTTWLVKGCWIAGLCETVICATVLVEEPAMFEATKAYGPLSANARLVRTRLVNVAPGIFVPLRCH